MGVQLRRRYENMLVRLSGSERKRIKNFTYQIPPNPPDANDFTLSTRTLLVSSILNPFINANAEEGNRDHLEKSGVRAAFIYNLIWTSELSEYLEKNIFTRLLLVEDPTGAVYGRVK